MKEGIAIRKIALHKRKYQSFLGTDFTLSSASHQHLSNFFWYKWFCEGAMYPMSIDVLAMREIVMDRFGEILPYHPHPDSKSEMKMLETFSTGNKIYSCDGQCVGEFIDIQDHPSRGEFIAEKSGIV